MRNYNSSSQRPAFTLAEVMISLAIVVLLILAISNIFSQASKTVGAGFAVSSTLRAQRSIGQSLRNDIAGYDPAGTAPAFKTSGLTDMSSASSETPFLLISGSRVSAFASRQDQQSDRDYVATDIPLNREVQTRTFDQDGSGTELSLPPAAYNERSHRTDLITFFSKGTFTRQTGNKGEYIGNVPQLTRAMITWGHSTLPDAAGTTYVSPGTGTLATNPDHFFANQFALARNAVLLAVPVAYGPSGTTVPERIIDVNGDEQNASIWPRDGLSNPAYPYPATATTAANDVLRPLTWGSLAWDSCTNGTEGTNYLLQQSRYDLAELKPGGASDLSEYRARVKARIEFPFVTWWQGLMGTPTHRYQATLSADVSVAANASKLLSPTTPIIAKGVSQFMVEFAGDFVTQDQTLGANLGKITAAEPDGVLDFTVAGTARGVKWYGLPRDVDGDGIIDGGAAASPALTVGQSVDVVPVRDAYKAAGSATNPNFEKALPTLRKNYRSLTVGNTTNDGMGPDEVYTCVWGPGDMVEDLASTPKKVGRPKLIRVIVTLLDEQGRIPDGLTQEYVFKVD